jgi:hypothetical protein
LLLQCEYLIVRSANDVIAQALCLSLGDFAAVSKILPFFLPFKLARFLIQNPDPDSDVPVRARTFLPKHSRHLMFSPCHSFSFEWLGQD